ncbi:arf-type small G protein [Mycena rebaudengoi]|nr:arf-type small G protein [Mycena rebaudengoi]
MFGIAWFWNALARLGLIRKCSKLLVLGLDNAGKTVSWEEFTIGNLEVSSFDLGGHPRGRRLWTDYFSVADAIVYLVDTVERPFLILGTKTDIPNAISEDELRVALGLPPTRGKARVPSSRLLSQLTRPIEVFMCSVPRKTGYEAGFEWLSRFLSALRLVHYTTQEYLDRVQL